MRDAAAGAEVSAQAARLVVDEGTPERLARAAAFAYAETGNFTALHLVTGTHAMRVLARFIDEGEARTAAWRWFWQAYAHGVVAAKLKPAAAATAAVAPEPWPELARRAVAARNEHVIKLVDAAREEERFYAAGGADPARPSSPPSPPGDWQRAAARALS
jgi:hypothetical protein